MYLIGFVFILNEIMIFGFLFDYAFFFFLKKACSCCLFMEKFILFI